jgi:hypothetical protein
VLGLLTGELEEEALLSLDQLAGKWDEKYL